MWMAGPTEDSHREVLTNAVGLAHVVSRSQFLFRHSKRIVLRIVCLDLLLSFRMSRMY